MYNKPAYSPTPTNVPSNTPTETCGYCCDGERRVASVHLNVDVNIADEFERDEEADRAQHEEEDVARQQRIAKELERLQQARHVRALHVVEQRVAEDKCSRRAGHMAHRNTFIYRTTQSLPYLYVKINVDFIRKDQSRKHSPSIEVAAQVKVTTYVPGTEHGPPPPAIVLGRQLEVGQGHRDARGHGNENAEDDGQYSVQRVLLATPQRREYVVEFH